MQTPEYDSEGNLIPTRPVVQPPTHTTPITTPTEKKSKFGTAAIVGIIIVVVAIFFSLRNHDAGTSVTNSVTDVAKEVPQAAKDAVKTGDQDTTRPNKDDSTKNLDQK
jgi:hypothetical protein